VSNESYVAIDNSLPALRGLLACILEQHGGRIVISREARIRASIKDVTIEITEQHDGSVEIVRGRHQ
jgi:hypothetical protein